MITKTLTKDYIHTLKLQGENRIAELVGGQCNNSANLIFILENLGQLPKYFNATWLVNLLENKNDTVRLLAVKNIGKLSSLNYLILLYKIATTDSSSIVKREAVSSIGRIKNRNTIPYLSKILNNDDPKIVCQAIRGLLVFKGEPNVDAILKTLINHENEMIRNVVYQEYFVKQNINKTKNKHSQTYTYLQNIVVNGDVTDVLELVPPDSIHLTFTSPPYYNARDYSIYPSYDAYLNFLKNVFEQTHRITKEGRFLIVNTSPIIIPRISRAHSSKRYPIPFDLHSILSNIGWDFIDDIIWEKPEYSVKNRIGGFQQHRKPLAYKPNSVTEYLMVYRKHTDKLLDWNMHQYDKQTTEDSKVADGFETTNVWKICPAYDKIHSAVFPAELCKRVIEYYSFKGDLVFDPFSGSGTVGRVARKMGRAFFLTEKEVKYFEYMKTLQCKEIFEDKLQTKFLTLEQFKNSVI